MCAAEDKNNGKQYKGILTDEVDLKVKSGAKKLALKIIAGILLLCFIAWLPVFFSKKARVTRQFNRGVSAFEHKNVEKTIKFVSDEYYDDVGSTKAMIGEFLPTIFGRYRRIKVNVKKLDIAFDGKDIARVTIEGSVYFMKEDKTMFALKGDGPATVLLRREGRRWRLYSVFGVGVTLNEILKETPI